MQIPKTTRRGFLRLSAGSAALLSVGSGLAGLTGCSKVANTAAGYKVLRQDDLYFLGAMAPAILTTQAYPGALGDQARERLLRKLDSILFSLNEYARAQLLMLLDLMNSSITRMAVGAPRQPWYEAGLEDSDTFLTSWRESRLQIKRMGYAGLCKLFCMAWYGQPETFLISGYPGTPRKIPVDQIATR